MNLKRWALATVAAFPVILVTDFLLHHVWLGEFYRATAQWWAPETQMQSRMSFMFLGQSLGAALLALVYARGYEPKRGRALQGLRFGALIGALLAVPCNLISYVIYPYPAWLLVTWAVGMMVQVMLAGAAIGAVYRTGK